MFEIERGSDLDAKLMEIERALYAIRYSSEYASDVETRLDRINELTRDCQDLIEQY